MSRNIVEEQLGSGDFAGVPSESAGKMSSPVRLAQVLEKDNHTACRHHVEEAIGGAHVE
jgi:hypothetical protein